jgi:hypothetical protein
VNTDGVKRVASKRGDDDVGGSTDQVWLFHRDNVELTFVRHTNLPIIE